MGGILSQKNAMSTIATGIGTKWKLVSWDRPNAGLAATEAKNPQKIPAARAMKGLAIPCVSMTIPDAGTG
jgi:hypothetical protein